MCVWGFLFVLSDSFCCLCHQVCFCVFEFGLVMSVGLPLLPSGTLVRKWCRLGHFGLDNNAVVTFVTLVIPGQLYPLSSLISMWPRKLNYKYNHLAPVSLTVCFCFAYRVSLHTLYACALYILSASRRRCVKLLTGLFTIMGSALLGSHTPFHNDNEWHEVVKEIEECKTWKPCCFNLCKNYRA